MAKMKNIKIGESVPKRGSKTIQLIANGILKIKDWEIKGEIKLTCNSSPVFNPKGSASPMCTIRISNKMYSYKIALSFAGRIRITKL